MEKVLIYSREEIVQINNYGRRYNEYFESIESPDIYPALLVWSMESCADHGPYLVYEWVYPSDFNE